MRIIFHIDVNSAYLSWTAVEQLKNGAKVDIRTIPAIIGGDQKSRHGIVLAKSIPAKKYGIRTGEPVANAFRKCPNLKSYPPDHQMYREYSRRLMDFLRTYTTHIEQVSVDECYMDFTEIADRFTSPVEGANEIKDEVYKRFGFTVNVGISSRKVLAKMASDFEKPNKSAHAVPGRSSGENVAAADRRVIYGRSFQCRDDEEAGNLYDWRSGEYRSGDSGITSEKSWKKVMGICQRAR